MFWSVTKSFKGVEEIERGTVETLAEAFKACDQNATIIMFNVKPTEFMDSVDPEFEDNQPLSGYSHFAISVIARKITAIPSVFFGYVIGQTLG